MAGDNYFIPVLMGGAASAETGIDMSAKSPNRSATETICSAFGSIVKVSHHYQPITAILYASRMATVASAIQVDKL